MSEKEEREKAGILFRVSQLHYMIVDRNRELLDVQYPGVAVHSNTFNASIRELDSEYTNSLRSQERQYFDAVKKMELDDLRVHVATMENRLDALEGTIPEGQSGGYIKFQSVEKYSTYNLDLYFNGETLRMVFEIETISNLAGNSTVTHRIEKSFPGSSQVENLVPGVNSPKPFNGYYYYPVRFPQGVWNLKSTGYSNNRYIQSKIRTDASISVMTYEEKIELRDEVTKNIIQEAGWYEKKIIEDTGYLIHGGGYTGSEKYDPYDNNRYQDRTLGCIRMNNDDVREIVPYVDAALVSGGRSLLHVAY
jgi:hypothetical protein